LLDGLLLRLDWIGCVAAHKKEVEPVHTLLTTIRFMQQHLLENSCACRTFGIWLREVVTGNPYWIWIHGSSSFNVFCISNVEGHYQWSHSSSCAAVL